MIYMCIIVLQFSAILTNGQIPVSLWREVNSVNSTAEFLERFAVPRIDAAPPAPQAPAAPNEIPKERPEGDSPLDDLPLDELIPEPIPDSGILNIPEENEMSITLFTVPGSINHDEKDRVSAMVATSANCLPILMPVSIEQPENPSEMYFPSCTQLYRCGGCCGHDLLYCAPAQEEVEIIKVVHAAQALNGAPGFHIFGMKDIAMVQHRGCACRCRTFPHYCNHQIHYYDDNHCSCSCKDPPYTCSERQHWSFKLCACVCQLHMNCNEDEIFNNHTCSCMPLPDTSISLQRSESETIELVETHSATEATINCRQHRCYPGYVARARGTKCTCLIPELEQTTTTTQSPGRRPHRGDMFPDLPRQSNRQPLRRPTRILRLLTHDESLQRQQPLV